MYTILPWMNTAFITGQMSAGMVSVAASPMTAVMSSSFFFFSSRRRHTRFDCDWSSDVCSSDLSSSGCVCHGSGRRFGDGQTGVAQAQIALLAHEPLLFGGQLRIGSQVLQQMSRDRKSVV